MSNSNGHLYLKDETLRDIIDFSAKKIVGKIMKRFEIIVDKDILKKEIKELLYENARDVSDLIYTAGKGIDPITKFNFTKKADS